MAGLGEMRYYVKVITYNSQQSSIGQANKSVKDTFYVFASVTESNTSESVIAGAEQGNRRVIFETIKTTETIREGDEIIYNNIRYRIDSISYDHHNNRQKLNGKANDRGNS